VSIQTDFALIGNIFICTDRISPAALAPQPEII
jgi:hypothetical protein